MEIVSGPFTFSSNFECGNLSRVVLISSKDAIPDCSTYQRSSVTRTNKDQINFDYEFNLWTKPDCSGTEFENNNRTWFCFCIKGGTPGKKVSLSIMNLNKQSKLYSQGMQLVVRCIGANIMTSNWERIKEKCSYKSVDNSTVVSWIHTIPEKNVAVYYAFTYPYTYSQLQSLLENYENKYASHPDIYFHRELLIRSIDGNRLDLLTISSNSKKLVSKEDKIGSLFPDINGNRPCKFKDKKIIFVSARVHPGETPSSFVLDGFLSFLLSSDSRAVKLRNLLVFKIIPMLNPDGVVRGHYRSDQRGINLNRVYTNPSMEFHPTIYATRKMILYYHFNMNLDALQKFEGEQVNRQSLTKNIPNFIDEDACHSFNDAVSKSKVVASTPNRSIPDQDEPSASGWDCSSNMSTDSSCRPDFFQSSWDDLQESHYTLSSSIETGVTNMFSSLSPNYRDQKLITHELKDISRSPVKILDHNFVGEFSPIHEKHPIAMCSELGSSNNEFKQHHSNTSQLNPFHTDLKLEIPETQTNMKDSPVFLKPIMSEDLKAEIKNPHSSVLPSILSAKSDLFMYIDLHGHASKRGIFMYGNWFENRTLMVENLLYPKLLSIHCSNFDFGACNFSEKNMYHKDRKDGMSKEGSGRVAVMRATGLVRSYTLECNYNTGRSVNAPSPATCNLEQESSQICPSSNLFSSKNSQSSNLFASKNSPSSNLFSSKNSSSLEPGNFKTSLSSNSSSSGFSKLGTTRNTADSKTTSKLSSLGPTSHESSTTNAQTPPKYTPAIFEDCGKKLGVSLHHMLEKCDETTTTDSIFKLKSLRTELLNFISHPTFSPKFSNNLTASFRPKISEPKLKGNEASTSKISPKIKLSPRDSFREKSPKGVNIFGGKVTESLFEGKSIVKKIKSPRRRTLSFVDAENQEPHTLTKNKKSKSKMMKSKKDLDFDLNKSKKIRYKLSSTKLSLLTQDVAPTSIQDFSCSGHDENLTFSTIENIGPQKSAMKKLEKGRKQQKLRHIKCRVKKFKNIPLVCDKKSDCNEINQVLESCLPIVANPLSPRSPLASVYEAPPSFVPVTTSIVHHGSKSKPFSSSSKSKFISASKRPPRATPTTLPSLSNSGDVYGGLIPPATGTRIKLMRKKLKKSRDRSELNAKSLKMVSIPTTSQAPVQWIVRKTPKINSERDNSDSVVKPKLKRRRKGGRKSI